MEVMLQHLGKGMWLTLMLSLPAVLLAAFIGLIIGILQAVTQVQEQTISAAPKILFVFLLLIFGGAMMMNQLEDYLRESVMVAFNEIPQDGHFVLPPKAKTADRTRIQEYFKERATAARMGKVRSLSGQQGPTDAFEDARAGVSVQITPDKAAPSLSEQMMLEKKNSR